MEKVIAGKTINVNENGYLTDFSQWTPEIADAIAKEENITLTDKHWAVIKYVQDEHNKGVELSIRKIRNSGVIDLKELYQLFPKGPLKTAAKIAGIPKPTSCI